MSSTAQNGAPRATIHNTADLEQGQGGSKRDASLHDASYRTMPSVAGDGSSSMASDRSLIPLCIRIESLYLAH